ARVEFDLALLRLLGRRCAPWLIRLAHGGRLVRLCSGAEQSDPQKEEDRDESAWRYGEGSHFWPLPQVVGQQAPRRTGPDRPLAGASSNDDTPVILKVGKPLTVASTKFALFSQSVNLPLPGKRGKRFITGFNLLLREPGRARIS